MKLLGFHEDFTSRAKVSDKVRVVSENSADE